MLFVALALLRIEKAVYLKLDLGLLGWTALLLPEIGFVLAFTSAFLLLARSQRPAAKVAWWTAFPIGLLAVYVLALADHLFFLHTATRLHLALLSYAIGNLKMLSAVLESGVDNVLWSRALLMLLCLALATLRGRRVRRPPPVRGAVPLLVGLVAGAGGGARGPPPPPPPPRPPPAALEFWSGVLRGAAMAVEDLETVPPDELYQRPQVVAAGEDRPDVVLILLESTRVDSVPPHAPRERWGETPALAALAERAVVFDTFYGSVTHTSKALIGMLCGMYPRLEMPIVETLDGNLPFACLPELLGDAGYRSAFLQTASGRFENRPGLIRNLGFDQGAFQETLERGGQFARTGYFGLDERAMIEPAVAWAAQEGDEPYLLTVLTVTPHHPYEVPGQQAWLGETLEQYRAAIRYQDRFVGELLGRLEEAGALDDAVVILAGDHGESFGEHGRLQHDAVPYEEVVRVPLLIVGPEERIGPPRRVEGLRQHLDLLPTILALTATRWTGRLPGHDLFDSAGHAQAMVSCWYTDYCLAMREGDRKVVFHYWRQPTEIFDLSRDPDERHNLAPTLPAEEVRSAERRLLSLKQSVDDYHAGQPVREGAPLWWNTGN